MHACCPFRKLRLNRCTAYTREYFLELVFPLVYTVIKTYSNFRVCYATKTCIADCNDWFIVCTSKLNDSALYKACLFKV